MTTRLQNYTKTFADRLLAAIEAGTAPWQQPWRPGELALPRNLTTARQYQGNNTVLLMVTAAMHGYSDPRWAGFRQIKTAGGAVRKGERGTPITVFRPRPIDDQDTEDEPAATDRTPRTAFCSVYHVFNLEQTEGLERFHRPAQLHAPARNCRDVVSQVATHAHIEIRCVPGDRACYNPRLDRITMPEREQFHDEHSYEQTLLHEFAHSTVHPTRLDRPAYHIANRNGDDYAIEELRAEVASNDARRRAGLGAPPAERPSLRHRVAPKAQGRSDAVRKATADAQRIADWLTHNVTKATEARSAV